MRHIQKLLIFCLKNIVFLLLFVLINMSVILIIIRKVDKWLTFHQFNTVICVFLLVT